MEDTNTTALVLQVAIGLLSLGGLVIGLLNTRANGGIKLKLAEVEARRTVDQGEVDNMSKIISLVEAVITGLKPSTDALNDAGQIMKSTGEIIRGLAGSVGDLSRQASDMHQVVERRDREAADDRRARDANHQELLTRLNEHQTQMDRIAKQITLATDENTLRHEVAKILLIAGEISRDVKRLPKESEPGETKAPDQIAVETFGKAEEGNN